jgi:2-succinyl-5-enolpyruvyl-6-hydroxy-3-cyclohexene-1-carboxylate synthase
MQQLSANVGSDSSIKDKTRRSIFSRKKRHSINIPPTPKRTVTFTRSSMTVSYQLTPKRELAPGSTVHIKIPSQDPLRHIPNKDRKPIALNIGTLPTDEKETTPQSTLSEPIACHESDEDYVCVSDSDILIPVGQLPQRMTKSKSEDMLDEDSDWVVIDHDVETRKYPQHGDLCDVVDCIHRDA